MRKLSEYPDADLRIFERPDPPEADRLRDVYLIGICGTGMGSLAGLFKEAGYTVSGSDAGTYPPMSVRLREMGISVHEGFDVDHLDPAPSLIIVGNVCTPTHPEAAEARSLRLPQVSFPEALKSYFIRDRKSLVVAGTHGKTTTTSMLVNVFQTAGIDTGYFVGGVNIKDGRSCAVGRDEYFIVEGDEYDSAYFDKRPKFLHYRPSSAVVTSVEFDHADIYESRDDYLEAFAEFIRLVPEDGLLVLNADDPRAAALARTARARVRTYGLDAPGVDITATDIVATDTGQKFSLVVDEVHVRDLELAMSGRHNLLNALGVCSIALDEGLPVSAIAEGLRSFQGIQRRQQIRGQAGGVIVVDDFAHHPTAVKATIQATRERWGNRRIVAVFEPRSNSSRRKIFEEGYSAAFRGAEAVFLSNPPFRHNDDPSNFMDIDVVLDNIVAHGSIAFKASGADELLRPLLEFLRPGDVALVMSNGGFGNIHERLLVGLAKGPQS